MQYEVMITFSLSLTMLIHVFESSFSSFNVNYLGGEVCCYHTAVVISISICLYPY